MPHIPVVRVTVILPVDPDISLEDVEGLGMVIAARAVQPPGPDVEKNPLTPIGWVDGAQRSIIDLKDIPAHVVDATEARKAAGMPPPSLS